MCVCVCVCVCVSERERESNLRIVKTSVPTTRSKLNGSRCHRRYYDLTYVFLLRKRMSSKTVKHWKLERNGHKKRCTTNNKKAK